MPGVNDLRRSPRGQVTREDGFDVNSHLSGRRMRASPQRRFHSVEVGESPVHDPVLSIALAGATIKIRPHPRDIPAPTPSIVKARIPSSMQTTCGPATAAAAGQRGRRYINRPKDSDFDLSGSRERQRVVIRPLARARGTEKSRVQRTLVLHSAGHPAAAPPARFSSGRPLHTFHRPKTSLDFRSPILPP